MARDLIAPTVVLCKTFIARLPERIREQLRAVRLEVMQTPTAALVEDGVEPTEPGAYIQRGEEGMPLADGMTDDGVTRTIYIFIGNMQPLTRQEVERVLLHEIGHACGLDEAEVATVMEGIA